MSLVAEGDAATVLAFANPATDWVSQWRYALAHTSWSDQQVDLHSGKRRTERATMKVDERGQVQQFTELSPVRSSVDRRWANPNVVIEDQKTPRYYYLNKDYML